jgi:hypothetical protein
MDPSHSGTESAQSNSPAANSPDVVVVAASDVVVAASDVVVAASSPPLSPLSSLHPAAISTTMASGSSHLHPPHLFLIARPPFPLPAR